MHACSFMNSSRRPLPPAGQLVGEILQLRCRMSGHHLDNSHDAVSRSVGSVLGVTGNSRKSSCFSGACSLVSFGGCQLPQVAFHGGEDPRAGDADTSKSVPLPS